MLTPILPRKPLLSYAKIASSLVMAACFVAPSQASTADLCDAIDELARTVAFNRQTDIPMMRMIKIADDYTETPAIRDLIVGVVIDAYSRPVYHSTEEKANFVVRFGEEWALACVKEFR